MKRSIILLLTITLAVSSTIAQSRRQSRSSASTNTSELNTPADSLSYIFGMLMGNQFNNSELEEMKKDINSDILIKGFLAGFNGETIMDESDAMSWFYEYFSGMEERAAQQNKERSEQFLAENAGKRNVQVTESGLQYVVHSEGQGDKPASRDAKVELHYEGKNMDGEVFDSSYERDESVEFRLSNVIEGFAEGVMLMSPGAKYTLYIPSELGYGEDGASGYIKANEALIFEVELIGIIDDGSAYDSDYDYDDDDAGILGSVDSDDDYSYDYDYNDEDEDEYDYEEDGPREAGDYTHNDIEGDEDIYFWAYDDNYTAFKHGNKYYVPLSTGLAVVDNSRKDELQLLPYTTGDTEWAQSYPNLGIFEPADGNGEKFLMLDWIDYDDDLHGTEVYTMNDNGALTHVGLIELTAKEDGYEGFFGPSAQQYLAISKLDGGKLRLDIKAASAGFAEYYREAASFPAEDLYYIYNNGGLKLEGEALSLTVFKRQALIQQIRDHSGNRVNVKAIGDMNGDGENDVLYTVGDDPSLMACLAKKYKADTFLALDTDFSYEFDDDRSNIIQNGKIYILIDDFDEGYQKRQAFVLQGSKLAEVEE